MRTAWEFLELLLKAVPCRIHTILTDNPVLSEVERGIQFAEQPRNRNTTWSRLSPCRHEAVPTGIHLHSSARLGRSCDKR